MTHETQSIPPLTRKEECLLTHTPPKCKVRRSTICVYLIVVTKPSALHHKQQTYSAAGYYVSAVICVRCLIFGEFVESYFYPSMNVGRTVVELGSSQLKGVTCFLFASHGVTEKPAFAEQ